MKMMDTVPSELNLVKKVADFRLISGKTMKMRKMGTVVNWPQTWSNDMPEEVSLVTGSGVGADKVWLKM